MLVLPATFGPATGTAALAQAPTPVQDPGGQGEDFGKSSPVALVLLLLFFVATALLVRSMTGHLKRLPASFDPPVPGSGAAPEPGRDQIDGDPRTGR